MGHLKFSKDSSENHTWDLVLRRTDWTNCATANWLRVAYWISKATRAQSHAHTNMSHLMPLHGNNDFVKTPQCYIKSTMALFVSFYRIPQKYLTYVLLMYVAISVRHVAKSIASGQTWMCCHYRIRAVHLPRNSWRLLQPSTLLHAIHNLGSRKQVICFLQDTESCDLLNAPWNVCQTVT